MTQAQKARALLDRQMLKAIAGHMPAPPKTGVRRRRPSAARRDTG